MRYSLITICAGIILTTIGCQKEKSDENWIKSNYTGSFKNITYTEQLIQTFTTGIYQDNEIPNDIKHLTYGRIEIDFHYNSGALTYFAPLFYYGSINKNNADDNVEKPKFHMAIEIGHYNVIPMPVDYMFYTLSTYRQPQYCRDTDCPLIAGINYTMVIDKRPEGIILQLKKNDHIINIFPHAFFPDSTQLFFNDITNYIDKNKGDSLQKVLMVGKGFAGFEDGIHEFNGVVSGLRIYKYTLSSVAPEYELTQIRNQLTENQEVTYCIKDNLHGTDKYIIVSHEFWPYKFESGEMIPNGPKQTGESARISNNSQLQTYHISKQEIGFYKLYVKTIDNEENIVFTSTQPFEIWVYPKEWNFEFYEL